MENIDNDEKDDNEGISIYEDDDDEDIGACDEDSISDTYSIIHKEIIYGSPLLMQQIQANDTDISEARFDLHHYCFRASQDDNFLLSLATALRNNTFVQTFYLINTEHCKFTINGWKEIFEMLQVNNTIQSVIFYRTEIDFDCVQVLATTVLLKSNIRSQLTKLDLSETQIGIIGVLTVVDALCTNPNRCKLTNLGLRNVIHENDNNIEMLKELAEKFAIILRPNCSCLEVLSLSINQLGDDFVTTLATILKYNTTLAVLDLSTTGITNIGAKALANALYYNRTLVELDLRDNKIGDDGAIAITKALHYHPSLKHLDLRSNGLRGHEVFEFLKYNETLKSFMLFCPDISAAAQQSIMDCNDILRCFNVTCDRADKLLSDNIRGVRSAPKKGVRRRQQVYNWLSKSMGCL
jgi:Ran GTPase-activating protein (RanGAP) involved in mRNA processing and transport